MRKKKLALFFIVVPLVIIFIAVFLTPTSPKTFVSECVVNPCDCQCYLKGEFTEQTGGTICDRNCEELFGITGCEYVGLKCPYDITGCAVVKAINDVFMDKQCEIVKGE